MFAVDSNTFGFQSYLASFPQYACEFVGSGNLAKGRPIQFNARHPGKTCSLVEMVKDNNFCSIAAGRIKPESIVSGNFGQNNGRAKDYLNEWALGDDSTIKQWIGVELDKEYLVTNVAFMSRSSCCYAALTGMNVFVGDQYGLDQPLCGRFRGGIGGQVGALPCTCQVIGRYVTFQPEVILSKGPGLSRVAIFGVDLSLV